MIAKVWLWKLFIFLLYSGCQAFVPSSPEMHLLHKRSQTDAQNIIQDPHQQYIIIRKDTALYGGGLLGGKQEDGKNDKPDSPKDGVSEQATEVLSIPVSSLKKGGLRFALGLHLVGLQDNGTWRPNEASSNKLDMFFKDNSAMFSITLHDDKIIVSRSGKPSLMYVLQNH